MVEDHSRMLDDHSHLLAEMQADRSHTPELPEP